jgi:gamma-glutamylcyclotransferase (GGCT)/AIG2-like uncharacterized protein YtfP
LNFFELVAYLQKSKQMKKDDVDALFRYPLSCLMKHPEVSDYIRDPKNDYQNLNKNSVKANSPNRNGRKTKKRYLFSYGTLLPDHAPREIAPMVRRFRRIGQGYVRGRLYDLGDYPAAVLARSGPLIRGLVFELPDDPEVLERLDKYEEFDRSHPERSLFIRTRRLIRMQDGTKVACWIYVYNRTLQIASPVPSGDYSEARNHGLR